MKRKLSPQLTSLCRAAAARSDKNKTFGSGEKKHKPKPISLPKIPAKTGGSDDGPRN